MVGPQVQEIQKACTCHFILEHLSLIPYLIQLQETAILTTKVDLIHNTWKDLILSDAKVDREKDAVNLNIHMKKEHISLSVFHPLYKIAFRFQAVYLKC